MYDCRNAATVLDCCAASLRGSKKVKLSISFETPPVSPKKCNACPILTLVI